MSRAGISRDVVKRLVSEGFEYRNGTKRNVNTGREIEVHTDRNGAMLVLIFIDGIYADVFELDSHEVACIGDLA